AAEQTGAEALGDAEHETADERAAQVADAAEHGRRERLDAEEEAGVVTGEADLQHVEGGGRAREQAADEERQLDDAGAVDTHERGRLRVLRHRADAAAEPG